MSDLADAAAASLHSQFQSIVPQAQATVAAAQTAVSNTLATIFSGRGDKAMRTLPEDGFFLPNPAAS
jgi:hypothetical protein